MLGREAGCELMRAERREGLFRWLPLVCERAGIPYAYTLTIWSAGALCIRRFGMPSVPGVFLFAAGGTIGYGALTLGVRLRRARSPATVAEGSSVPGPVLLWENVVALPAIAVGAGVSALVPEADASFLLVPLTATITYLTGLAVLVSVTAGARCTRRSAARRTCLPSGLEDRDDPSRGVGRTGEGRRRAGGM